MKKKAIVLGAGRIGSVIARDLKADFDVTLADLRADHLAKLGPSLGVKTLTADLADPAAVTRAVAPFDLVVGALSSHIGLQTLRAVIEAGKTYCDVSFMPEDALALSDLARAKGVTCVVDCGVAPGVSNMMAGYGSAQLDVCDSIEIYVGGLPEVRHWPYNYKAGFSPADVVEEYIRPSRIVENGKIVVKPALSEPELMNFPRLGTLEAFNTDGLRSLAYTLKVPDMKEKTLRYPGHIELMRVLRETGFFSKEPITVGGKQVVPLEVTSALLFPKWAFDEREADITVMRVITAGKKNGEPTRYVWDLNDRYDPETDTRSMSRTTAFPTAIMARFLADGKFAKPGVHAPETPAREPGILDAMLVELAKRGVHYALRTDKGAAALAPVT